MHGYKWPINCTRTRTGMRDESGGAVANALHHATELRTLDLSSNEIAERAAMVINL